MMGGAIVLSEDRICAGRKREVFYDEIRSIEMKRSNVIVHCHDGRRHVLKDRNGADLAKNLAAIVSEYPRHLEKTQTLADVESVVRELHSA